MYYLVVVFSGFVGTMLMTAFMKIVSVIGSINLEAPKILGALITMETKPSGTPSSSSLRLTLDYSIPYLTGIFLRSFIPSYGREVLGRRSSVMQSFLEQSMEYWRQTYGTHR